MAFDQVGLGFLVALVPVGTQTGQVETVGQMGTLQAEKVRQELALVDRRADLPMQAVKMAKEAAVGEKATEVAKLVAEVEGLLCRVVILKWVAVVLV